MIPFPDKKYSIIYADPPWSYSDSGCSGAAAAQYATMSINELKQLPVNPAGGGLRQAFDYACAAARTRADRRRR